MYFSFPLGSCEKLRNKSGYSYPMSQTIGEEEYFEVGNSLNQVMYKYSREVKHFCLHSDWAIGYLANFHNISRHTPTGYGYDFDDRFAGAEHIRLHAFPQKNHNSCSAGGPVTTSGCCPKHCRPTDTTCHGMNAITTGEVHSLAKKKFLHHSRS